jgi:hypothetical protein
MLSKVFVYGTDDDSGITGWRPKDNPMFMPGDGLLVAHDTLEHFADDTGTLEDELRALGALSFIRLDSGMAFLRNPYMSRDAILGGLIYSTVSDAARDNVQEIAEPPRTACLDEDVYGDRVNDDMAKAVSTAIALLTAESASEQPLAYLLSKEASLRIRGWLRIGYRAAHKRFRGDCCGAETLLKDVWNQVKAINHQNEPSEGDELRVSASLAQFRAVVTYSTGCS